MNIYLYIKEHSVTGLKYFGKTERQDPYSYLGSGKRWLRHIRKHGKEYVRTIQVWKFDNKESCTNFALSFSKQNDIVNSSEWANLIEENGLDGAPAGVKFSEEHKSKLRNRVRTSEHCRKLSENHAKPNLGKKLSLETRKKMSENNVGFSGKKHSEETKLKQKMSQLGKPKPKKPQTCPVCGLTGKGGNMKRYHFSKCKALK